MKIESREDYWNIVREYKQDLLNIMWQFIPMEKHEWHDGTFLEKPLHRKIDEMIDNEDPEFNSVLQKTWWLAPDDPSIHRIKSWYILCDLCSENWVLYEDDPTILDQSCEQDSF